MEAAMTYCPQPALRLPVDRGTLWRLPLVVAAVLGMAACQAGFEQPGLDPATAERALPAVGAAGVPIGVPAGMAAGIEACWTQTRLTGADGRSEDHLVAVPCPAVLDVEFWASLQRALAVRGHFDGAINGIEDEATRAAVRRYQAPMGFDSPILSLDAARHLGLLPWPRAGL